MLPMSSAENHASGRNTGWQIAIVAAQGWPAQANLALMAF